MVARKDTLRTEELSALRQVRGALPEADILLVGAVAIDRHIALARQTDDMDLAIGIELEDFPGPLGSIHGWRHDQARAEHRFFTEYGLQLDIIPAGASIRERGMIRWPSGFEMSLVGFDVAFRRADRVDLEGVRVLCPALPELLLLKIAAWLDRRHERQKDLGDIAVLLRNYLEDDHERHWHDEIQAGALVTICRARTLLDSICAASARLVTSSSFMNSAVPRQRISARTCGSIRTSRTRVVFWMRFELASMALSLPFPLAVNEVPAIRLPHRRAPIDAVRCWYLGNRGLSRQSEAHR